MTSPWFDKMMTRLIKDGLVVRDGDAMIVTPKGDEYTRALIADLKERAAANMARMTETELENDDAAS